MQSAYRLETSTPTVDDYCRLRLLTGLSPKTEQAARIGLANSLFAVQIRFRQQVVGMGRLVGDGACHCQICDIAVLPEHQGQGLGKQIMQALMQYVTTQLPDSCYVNLIADGDARFLYSQFGFADVAPASIGMGLSLPLR